MKEKTNQSLPLNKKYIFLIPVFNDWQSLNKLLKNIDKNIAQVKAKIFKEIKNGSEKDSYFTDEERNMLSNFINKIVSELNVQNK